MAKITQWTAWRHDYLKQFRFMIDDSPVRIAAQKLKESKIIDLNLDKARAFINEAIQKGFIDYSAPEFFYKAFLFAFIYGHSRWHSPISVEDAESEYKAGEAQGVGFDCLNRGYTEYFGYVGWFINGTISDTIRFYIRNNPLVYRRILEDIGANSVNLSYCRMSQKQLFSFFCTMTPFGLFRLLTDINCPCADAVFDAVQKGQSRTFNRLCSEYNLDFTNVSEIAGVLENYGWATLADEDFEEKVKELNTMIGNPNIRKVTSQSAFFRKDLLCELFPFEMSEEEALKLTCLAFNLSELLPYFNYFTEEELQEVNRVLDNPAFVAYKKLVQFVYAIDHDSLPTNVSIALTIDEQERFLPGLTHEANSSLNNTLQPNNQDEDDAANLDQVPEVTKPDEEQTQDIKTLASRWMTELYQRMTDDVLVEIVSKKIWPQLQDEVDSLKWAPSKRVLPTFQKTKNMMAACILFHALELAKIARLPKQEKEALSEGFYMSAEERAQYGIYETSKRNAGIAHTKKRYNDTLPVGYMETLERFIKEEELPGRTTSRTYLKLVNKWVKTDPDEISDNIYTQAKQLLNESEMEKDLGPQLYLLKDNRVRLKSMLKEWRDLTPELFNIPI